jgi:hypothetical protein
MPATSGAPRRFCRFMRLPAMTGALIAISSFCRAEAAARFDGFFASTAKPYGQKRYG